MPLLRFFEDALLVVKHLHLQPMGKWRDPDDSFWEGERMFQCELTAKYWFGVQLALDQGLSGVRGEPLLNHCEKGNK